MVKDIIFPEIEIECYTRSSKLAMFARTLMIASNLNTRITR